MNEIKQGFKCVICEKWTLGWGPNKQYGHDPSPIVNHGECCDECDDLVLRARLNSMKKEGNK